jgi:hypothetical protein
MQKQIKKNNNTIDKAFDRLCRSEYDTVLNGYRRMLDEAIEYSLHLHDVTHHKHLEIGDTYAFGIFKDGVMVDSKVWPIESDKRGNVMRHLNNLDVPKRGWVGVVMAEMSGSVAFFSTEFEITTLSAAIGHISQMFRQFFDKR